MKLLLGNAHGPPPQKPSLYFSYIWVCHWKSIAPPGGQYEYHRVARLASQLRHRLINKSTCNADLWEGKKSPFADMLFVVLFIKKFTPFLGITFHSNLGENCSECGLKGRLKAFKQMDQTKCHGGGVIKTLLLKHGPR